MSLKEPSPELQRAAQLSRQLAELADTGDVELTQCLDAERLQLLKSARQAVRPLGEGDHALLREIASLNDKAIGFLEHRRRCKARDLDMLSVGKRAMRAYSENGRYR